ncbi:hypothetical protein H5410_036225 [Solanum commersonii]|uniref:Flotillin-like n=1 Tax=Solanum commersonii TaxID=4109 RepID=A0A9J5Y3K2_SOLCO|nr:hypothetical protein H5410_036225 [Solanum commersonii]
MYHVARASEFLVITGIGINELKITKKALVHVWMTVRLIKYAKLLSHHARDSHNVKDLVQGVIEGETRVLATSMTMDEIFKGTKDFKKEVFDKKTQMEAANQAKINVSEAKMKGEIGSKEREGLTHQNAAKIDAEPRSYPPKGMMKILTARLASEDRFWSRTTLRSLPEALDDICGIWLKRYWVWDPLFIEAISKWKFRLHR